MAMELSAAAAIGLAGSAVLAKFSYGEGGRSKAAMEEALEKLDLHRLLRRLAHEDGLGKNYMLSIECRGGGALSEETCAVASAADQRTEPSEQAPLNVRRTRSESTSASCA